MPTTKHRGRGFRSRRSARHRIVVVAVPPVEELDLVGPLQVFASANRLAGKSLYAIEVVTCGKSMEIPGEGGMLSFLAQGQLSAVRGGIDSALLVCGVASRHTRSASLSRWLRETAPAVRRLGAVCVGAFLLAQAQLLNGRRATSHWKFAPELAARFPRIRVETDPLWVKDGNLYTSAGITAGIDLALAWVEEDCGSALVHEVARELVLFLRRPSNQQQLSVSLAAQAADTRTIQELQVWLADNLAKPLCVRDLAERASMASRTFQRAFTREVGTTASRYILQLRVEAARRQLELTDKGLKQIAIAAGFSGVDVMRRAFVRVLGVTPGRYLRKPASREVNVSEGSFRKYARVSK